MLTSYEGPYKISVLKKNRINYEVLRSIVVHTSDYLDVLLLVKTIPIDIYSYTSFLPTPKCDRIISKLIAVKFKRMMKMIISRALASINYSLTTCTYIYIYVCVYIYIYIIYIYI